MRKIAVIGSPGAGKSPFSRRLAEILKIEVFHLDALHWRPGWVETPDAEWEAVQRNLIKRDSWIIDGNYGGTIGLRVEAADTIIFLDLPRMLCVWRVVKRRFQNRGKTRPDMGEGCPEKLLDPKFPLFLKFIWHYPTAQRPNVLAKLAAVKNEKEIVHLQSTGQVKGFLQNDRFNQKP